MRSCHFRRLLKTEPPHRIMRSRGAPGRVAVGFTASARTSPIPRYSIEWMPDTRMPPSRLESKVP